MFWRLLATIPFALLLSAQPQGQAHPNLAGTWELVKSDSTGADVPPSTVIIVQSPGTVTFEHRGEQISRLTYVFKTPSPDVMPPELPGATSVGDATAKWVDDRLETSAILTISGKTVTQTSRWKVDAAGNTLTVVKDLMVHHGYETSPANSTATEVYRKRAQ